jgi:hypothetical protein
MICRSRRESVELSCLFICYFLKQDAGFLNSYWRMSTEYSLNGRIQAAMNVDNVPPVCEA